MTVALYPSHSTVQGPQVIGASLFTEVVSAHSLVMRGVQTLNGLHLESE